MKDILCVALGLYVVILFVRIISSWFPRPYAGPWATFLSVLYQLTEPALRPLRNLIPPIRIGMMALDLSPIIVFVVLSVLRTALRCGPVLGIF